jgi:hypothetical protein
MSHRDKVKKLKRLYASIPDVGCKGLCQECCGPMGCSTIERDQIEAFTGKEFPIVESGPCPFLKEGRCSIYPVRPTVCRLWGSVEDMSCPYGCKPRMTARAGRMILRQVREITGEDTSNEIHTHPHFYKKVIDLKDCKFIGVSEGDVIGHLDSLIGPRGKDGNQSKENL